MRTRPVVFALWLLAGAALLAATPPGSAGTKEPAEKKKERELSKAEKALAELTQTFQKEVGALEKEFDAAKADADREKLRGRFLALIGGHTERLAAFVEANAGDPAGRQAEAELREGLQLLGNAGSPAVTQVLRSVLAKITRKDLKAEAALAVGASLRTQAEKAYQKKEKARSAGLSQEAEDLLEPLAKDPGDLVLGRRVRDALYQLKHLTAGKTAPDLAAEDVDGKKFKLSDYRGKVVVLDFWAFW